MPLLLEVFDVAFLKVHIHEEMHLAQVAAFAKRPIETTCERYADLHYMWHAKREHVVRNLEMFVCVILHAAVPSCPKCDVLPVRVLSFQRRHKTWGAGATCTDAIPRFSTA